MTTMMDDDDYIDSNDDVDGGRWIVRGCYWIVNFTRVGFFLIIVYMISAKYNVNSVTWKVGALCTFSYPVLKWALFIVLTNNNK